MQPQIVGLGAQGRGFDPHGRRSFSGHSRFEARGNDDNSRRVPTQPWLRPKLCKMWQILHDRALKIVADFSLMFDFGTLPLRKVIDHEH